MDEEHLHNDLRVFKDRNFFQQKLRSFFTVYLLLALSFLLIIILFAVSLSRVSAISSKLDEVRPEQKQNFSSRDSLQQAGTRRRLRARRCTRGWLSLTATPSRTRNERFWIGLTDENSEGEWEWIDGTDYKTTFTFWKEGEPNNSGNNEDCAHLWVSGKWNDVYCTYECYYVCEKPLPP
ncbi:hepatic lectin-like isoform X2 [Falco naumanni]|uniref:hepatic lectin-like isoform X2 n=1 Tax=Falco naumanni TaxID=148594 RepID=UPI001ADE7FBF|nr:hepatic lectin-like isoform X2 [Falco naumanni]